MLIEQTIRYLCYRMLLVFPDDNLIAESKSEIDTITNTLRKELGSLVLDEITKRWNEECKKEQHATDKYEEEIIYLINNNLPEDEKRGVENELLKIFSKALDAKLKFYLSPHYRKYN